METRQDKNDEKQKENEKDQKKTYKENGRFDSHYLNRQYDINLNFIFFNKKPGLVPAEARKP